MHLDITNDMQRYRQCLLAIWQDITGRLEPDWNTCDAFADTTCRVFDLYIAEKYGIASKKARQYDQHPLPVREILTAPRSADSEIVWSHDFQQWEKYRRDPAGTPFYWIDFYDFDLIAKDRRFEYVLAQDDLGRHVLFAADAAGFFIMMNDER